jgi:hypothetical protein
MCYTLLSYIIRSDAFPTGAQMQAPLLDIDTTLVKTLSFTNPYYHDDSRRVYVLLKNLTLGGTGWPHILNYDIAQDGRGSWVTLKAQAKGPAALEQGKQVAYNTTSSDSDDEAKPAAMHTSDNTNKHKSTDTVDTVAATTDTVGLSPKR